MKEIADRCACGCKREIFVGDSVYEYEGFRFKYPDCVAKHVGAKWVKVTPYRGE